MSKTREFAAVSKETITPLRELIASLREHAEAFAEPRVMEMWDAWRRMIAGGSKASLPRDGFESLIDGVAQDTAAAADALEKFASSEMSTTNAAPQPVTSPDITSRVPSGPAVAAPSTPDKVGRIPDLEGARINADYWMTEARKLNVGHAEKQLCMEQAVNAWRNAAYVMADQRDALSSASTPLERFGLAVLEEHRNEITDLDGGWIQDKAVELGLLAGVTVVKPCSEQYCKCAEYGDFPQECLRETDAIRAKMAEFRASYVVFPSKT